MLLHSVFLASEFHGYVALWESKVYSSHTGEAYSQLVLVRIWFGLRFIMKCLTNSLGAGQSGGHA